MKKTSANPKPQALWRQEAIPAREKWKGQWEWAPVNTCHSLKRFPIFSEEAKRLVILINEPGASPHLAVRSCALGEERTMGGTVSISSGPPSWIDTTSTRSFSRTMCSKPLRMFPARSRTATGHSSISILPASILDSSRTSLMSASRSSPLLWMILADFTCLGLRFPSLFSSRSLARRSKLLR